MKCHEICNLLLDHLTKERGERESVCVRVCVHMCVRVCDLYVMHVCMCVHVCACM